MPHFYRYTGDDEDYRSKSEDCPENSSDLDEANITCLGLEANISVPAGNDKNKTNINILFDELDKTLQGLQEENKKLREEVAALRQGQVMPEGKAVSKLLEERLEKLENSLKAPDENKNRDDMIDKLATGVEDIKIKVNELESQQKDYENKTQSIIEEFVAKIQEQNTENQNSNSKEEAVELNTDLVKKQDETNIEEPPKEQTEDILTLVKILQEDISKDLANLKASLTTPLSVMFDAIRSEDWKGMDDFLPFDKLVINLGEGFNIETGKFTAPVSGLYFFSLNVYGAPRDAIILSIRANEFEDVGNLQGVGKGSQSVLVQLDKRDTCGVWVDEKTKMTDSPTNHYTHFIGILLRPKGL